MSKVNANVIINVNDFLYLKLTAVRFQVLIAVTKKSIIF
jgi:hypothetical protein